MGFSLLYKAMLMLRPRHLHPIQKAKPFCGSVLSQPYVYIGEVLIRGNLIA